MIGIAHLMGVDGAGYGCGRLNVVTSISDGLCSADSDLLDSPIE